MKKTTIVQEVPAATVIEKNVRDFSPTVAASVYDVYSWRDGLAGSDAPCSEVHVVIPVVDGIRVALRLKSARAVDELVAVLLEYRREVFK